MKEECGGRESGAVGASPRLGVEGPSEGWRRGTGTHLAGGGQPEKECGSQVP